MIVQNLDLYSNNFHTTIDDISICKSGFLLNHALLKCRYLAQCLCAMGTQCDQCPFVFLPGAFQDEQTETREKLSYWLKANQLIS